MQTTLKKNLAFCSSAMIVSALLPAAGMAQDAQPPAEAAPVVEAAPIVEAAPATEAPPAINGPLLAQGAMAPAEDTITVSRSEWEQMKRDIEALKGNQGSGGQGMAMAPKAEPGHAKGWYASVSGGPQSRKQSEDIGLGTAARFADGYSVNGALGYRFKSNIRVEAEATHQNNKNQRFVTDINAGTSEEVIGGNVTLNSISANIYYDIPIKKMPRLKPFLGGGYGYYQSSINGLASPSLSGSPPGGIAAVIQSSSREVHLWQYRLGVAYAVTPNSELTLAYRRFLGSELGFNFLAFPGGTPTVIPLSVTGGNTKTIEAGFRVFF